MKIEQNNQENKGHFEAKEEEIRAGLMTYSWAGDDKIIIDHTEVNADFKGKGVGKEMVKAAVDFAREKNIKIIPLCPFAKSVFEKVTEWQDVVSK